MMMNEDRVTKLCYNVNIQYNRGGTSHRLTSPAMFSECMVKPLIQVPSEWDVLISKFKIDTQYISSYHCEAPGVSACKEWWEVQHWLLCVPWGWWYALHSTMWVQARTWCPCLSCGDEDEKCWWGEVQQLQWDILCVVIPVLPRHDQWCHHGCLSSGWVGCLHTRTLLPLSTWENLCWIKNGTGGC